MNLIVLFGVCPAWIITLVAVYDLLFYSPNTLVDLSWCLTVPRLAPIYPAERPNIAPTAHA